ncbi:MAG: hypothetical protein NTV57_08520 [Cyanobacteria bacterium]|nr:hypothetical protein [Cyanobacteriota bacterium]
MLRVLQADRVLIGGEDPSAVEALAAIYSPWVPPRTNSPSSIHSLAALCCSRARRI